MVQVWLPELQPFSRSSKIILVGLKTDLSDQFEERSFRESKTPSELLKIKTEEDNYSSKTSAWEHRQPATLQRHRTQTADGQLNAINRHEGEDMAQHLCANYVEGNVIDVFSDLNSLPHKIVDTVLNPPQQPEKCIHIFPRGMGFKLVYVHRGSICRKAWDVKIPGFQRFHI